MSPVSDSDSRTTKNPPLQVVAIAGVFGIVMAFLGYEMTQFKRAGKQVHGVELQIAPTSVQVAPGTSQEFTATIRGSENTDLGWTIAEGARGGTVAPLGGGDRDGWVVRTSARYTAPPTAGTYHVVVTSKADETRSATATITVAK